jgi:hypothetical protein
MALTVETIDGNPESERASATESPSFWACVMPVAAATATRLTTVRWATTRVGRGLSVKRR